MSKRRTDGELVRRAKRLPWLFEPGTDYAYSNTGFVAVGMMLAKATGERMPALVRTRILKPARMTESTFATRRGMLPPRLREYARIGGEKVDLRTFHPSIFSSAGALVTTARDLNRFQRALAGGRLIERRLVREMRSVVADDDQTGLEYGLGSHRLPDPCPARGRYLHGHDGASWGTLTWSFAGSPAADRRVTIAMTGRPFGLKRLAKVQRLLVRFVFAAAATGCAGAPAWADRTTTGIDHRIVPPLAE